MDVAVTLEQRYDRTPDGMVWTEALFAYPFWLRYLEAFDRVRIVARVQDVPEARPGWLPATGEGVSIFGIPHYIGPSQYITKARSVGREVRAAVDSSEAFILRAPGMMSMLAYGRLRSKGRPYGVEVVADPYDGFAPGATKHPLRPFFRWWFSRELRRQCAGASATSYVTEKALQGRYTAGAGAFVTHYSDVDLPDAAFARSPRSANGRPDPVTLISVTSFNMMYKAQDVLIDAVRLCVQRGMDLRLVFVGDGKHRPEMERHAGKQGLNGRVQFLGQLPSGEAVRAQLDQADLFVLPSRTEGLPRAMIEAMARALPCMGSTAGGIPELLPAEDMVPPEDPVALAKKIREIASDPVRMASMSARGLQRAKGYREDTLRERRVRFYERVRDETMAWIKRPLR